jgi:hypothetical protein
MSTPCRPSSRRAASHAARYLTTWNSPGTHANTEYPTGSLALSGTPGTHAHAVLQVLTRMRSISARFHVSIVFDRTKLRCTPASSHSATQVHACEYVRHKALLEATRQVRPQWRTLQPCIAACCIRTKPAVAAAALDAHDDAAATQRSRAYGPRRTRWHSAVSEPARRHDSAIIVQRVGAAFELPGGRARLSGPRLNRV